MSTESRGIFWAKVYLRATVNSGQVSDLFSVVQWIGLLLMLIGVPVAVAGRTPGEYAIFISLLGGLILFVVLGNRRARRKTRSPENQREWAYYSVRPLAGAISPFTPAIYKRP